MQEASSACLRFKRIKRATCPRAPFPIGAIRAHILSVFLFLSLARGHTSIVAGDDTTGPPLTSSSSPSRCASFLRLASGRPFARPFCVQTKARGASFASENRPRRTEQFGNHTALNSSEADRVELKRALLRSIKLLGNYSVAANTDMENIQSV